MAQKPLQRGQSPPCAQPETCRKGSSHSSCMTVKRSLSFPTCLFTARRALRNCRAALPFLLPASCTRTGTSGCAQGSESLCSRALSVGVSEPPGLPQAATRSCAEQTSFLGLQKAWLFRSAAPTRLVSGPSSHLPFARAWPPATTKPSFQQRAQDTFSLDRTSEGHLGQPPAQSRVSYKGHATRVSTRWHSSRTWCFLFSELMVRGL